MSDLTSNTTATNSATESASKISTKTTAFKPYLWRSLGLHAVLLALMSISVAMQPKVPPGMVYSKVKVDLNPQNLNKSAANDAQKKLINASMIDQNLVNKALNRQKQHEDAK
jgi:hypothetical protein